MLYLILLFMAFFIFHFIHSNKFEKENHDLFENKKKKGNQPRETEIIL